MIDLIRNCVHHSDHSTYIERGADGTPTGIRKVSFTPSGTSDLGREIRGLEWYCTQQNLAPSTVITEADIRDRYAKIRMAYHSGETVKVPVDPALLTARLDALLTHHFAIFSADDFKHTHGDYSICNHVFDGNQVKWVIDWEHFNDQLPRSYDVVYAVLEPYLFWIANNHTPSGPSIVTLRELLGRIRTEMGDDAIPVNPAMWLRTLVEQNKDVWGPQWAKVPFIAFDTKHVEALDKALTE